MAVYSAHPHFGTVHTISRSQRWRSQTVAPIPTASTDADAQLTRQLVEVATRLYDQFSPHVTFAEVLTVVGECRRDLDIATTGSLPELVERLARQRLTDRLSDDSSWQDGVVEGKCLTSHSTN